MWEQQLQFQLLFRGLLLIVAVRWIIFNSFPGEAGEPTLGSLSTVFSLNRIILEQLTGPQRPRCHLASQRRLKDSNLVLR